MPRSKPPRVAVIVDPSSGHARDVLAGVLDHARPRGWRLVDDPDDGETDGMIIDAALPDRPAKRRVRFSLEWDRSGDVCLDVDGIITLCHEHYRDRGYTHVYIDPSPLDILATGPIACCFSTDAAAAAAVRKLLQLGRKVPDEVAVLGIGDDPLLCERCEVPISSVRIDSRQIGRLAAARLGRLLAGRAAGEAVYVGPIAVTCRASTDTFAVNDADLVTAARFIRDHAAGPLRVGDVLRVSGLDRRTLERRFAKHFGRSPAQMIRHVRVEIAAKLLRETTQPMTQIARATGFRLPQHLAAAFKAVRGQTPSDYRALMAVVDPVV